MSEEFNSEFIERRMREHKAFQERQADTDLLNAYFDVLRALGGVFEMKEKLI